MMKGGHSELSVTICAARKVYPEDSEARHAPGNRRGCLSLNVTNSPTMGHSFLVTGHFKRLSSEIYLTFNGGSLEICRAILKTPYV
jgi:hypothetical protein